MSKRWVVVSGVVGLALLACTGGPPERPQPPSQPQVSELPPVSAEDLEVLNPPPPGVEEAQGPGPRHPFTCCDSRSVERILEEYLDLQQALYTEANTTPSAETYALQGVLKSATKDKTLPEDERRIIGELVRSLDSIKDGDLEEIRTEFDDISRHVLFLSFSHQGGEVEVAEAWCGDKPWLQQGEALHSPWADKDCGRWR